MAMVLYFHNIINVDIFCRYENGFGVYFDWCIQPTKNGIDFIGYKHFIDKILIRKSSKIRIFKKLKNNITNKYKLTEQYIQSYLGSLNGWLKWSSDESFKNKVYFKLQEL